MATAIIKLIDDENGRVTVDTDFGDAIDEKSTAHQMGLVLLNSILTNANDYQKIEDTAPEKDVEPSRIITNEGTN